jgi:adenine-specific DNA-methyltransferase
MKIQDIEHLKNVILQAQDMAEADKNALMGLLNSFSSYGLVWVDKEEDFEVKMRHGYMPSLKEILEKRIESKNPILVQNTDNQIVEPIKRTEDAPHHQIIEGDNLPVLIALCERYSEAVDIIYIDPPYNTGNRDYKYNDHFSDKNDAYRHSKWLSFMHKRLILAQKLLKKTGIIFISIDDNEQAQLKLLCDEIFGETNFIQDLIWQNKYTVSNDAKFFSKQHDYILCYAKNAATITINLLEKTDKAKARYRNPDNDPRGVWKATPLDARSGSAANIFEIKFPNNVIWKPTEGRYSVYSKEKLMDMYHDNRLWFGKNGMAKPSKKTFLSEAAQGMKCGSILSFEEFGHTHKANDQLAEILGKGTFTSPKPVDLIYKLLELTTKSDTSALILDFFAGSGTTLHATMQRNADDGGNRQCILVTNNENGIAEKVCYERNKRVIQGYIKPNGAAVEGLSNNHLHYYILEAS